MSDYGEMKWSVRVSARDQNSVAVYARKKRFDVGSPLAFDVEEEGTSAFEYMLGAIGADLVAGMKELCHRRRLEVDNVEAFVVGELDNALAHLGVVGEEGHPGLSSLAVKVFVETLEEEDDIRKVWDEMLERSPLYRTFSSIARFDMRLQIAM
jgi:hypothetical protein